MEYQYLLDEWMNNEKVIISFSGFSASQISALKDFASWLDTERGLTTDAPEMTVGDSSPINEQNTNDPGGFWTCPKCQTQNRNTLYECWCGRTRPNSDGLPAGHHGSSLECMHPFCVAEREQMSRPSTSDKPE